MERKYKRVAAVRGINALILIQALHEGRSLEFDIEMNGDVIIRAVDTLKPECRREFESVRSSDIMR